jgi:NAD(P) transhydrogenase subunit alpha
MKVGIPREIGFGERRVAATPETTKRLVQLGFEVSVERGAGERASFTDEAYRAAGATLVDGHREVLESADVVLKVRPLEQPPEGDHEADLLREGAFVVSFVWPAKNKELLERLAKRKANVLAMDLIPRITRAQKMDALSSMANIAGYRAVIEAASFFGRFFTGQITAAGKVPPAKVLVIGAGVAGLAAIGAARGLGAIVRAFDTRPAVKEQVESMGAEFLSLEVKEDAETAGGYAKEMSPAFIAAEMALFEAQAREVDIVITTALIPGKPAPQLLTTEIVEAMKPGSVIVDLAAEAGGNCALTQPGQVITHAGVTIVGFVDLPSRLAPTASQLYGTNLTHLLADMGGGKSFHVDLDDEVVNGALVMKDGELRWPPPARSKPPEPRPSARRTPSLRPPTAHVSTPPAASVPATASASSPAKHPNGHHHHAPVGGKGATIALLVACLGIAALSRVAPSAFLSHLTVFVLACFVGWQVVWNVTPALHTPLMSVTNAVSGIILVGGMLAATGPLGSPATILGLVAILLASINVAGGFLVTRRMLAMFRK